MADALDDDTLLAAVAAHSGTALEVMRFVHAHPELAVSAARLTEPV